MELAKKDLVQLLHGQGDNDTAERVEAADLPDTIDTARDADALTAVGLDQQTLLGHLAGGAIGGNLAM
ncbi:hypothetical protein [Modestobacter sp. Leaf380]|uniref:hypothetical protein n=1 Tax=Modestobacter sp. Leaf380 TaxID=1736356 RepID=UPI0006F88F9D|nr:hypothetical protein [Modestobacter sp. Leaf380]KQS66720.1 hypothetical protein ASG41_09765 [Modestobacter sp. Leaf380]